MQEQIKRQTEEFFKAAREARVPENFQAIAQEGVAKTRDAYLRVANVAKDQAKLAEDVFLAASAGAKSIGEKVFSNAAANADAAFDAAQAIARAKTLPEAARVHADYVQQQIAVASQQTKDLFELSARIARQTLESVSAAATKSFDQLKKAN